MNVPNVVQIGIVEVNTFKSIPASGIPAVCRFLPCDLARKQDHATDGGDLIAMVIAPGKFPQSIVKAKNQLGVLSTHPFFEGGSLCVGN